MIFLKWQEDFSVGVSILDSHHQKMLDMISDFYAGVKDNQTETWNWRFFIQKN